MSHFTIPTYEQTNSNTKSNLFLEISIKGKVVNKIYIIKNAYF